MQLVRLLQLFCRAREMATSSSDIARLLNVAASDSSALAEVFTEYFVECDAESDHEFSDDEDFLERETSSMRR